MGQSSSAPVDLAHQQHPPPPRVNHHHHHHPNHRSNIHTPNHHHHHHHVDPNNNTDANQAKKETLKIPSAWKTKEQAPKDFVVISPQSDISNPSHFRGLFVTKHPTTSTATTKNHHHQQQQHRRISKVAMKLSPPPFIKSKKYATATTTMSIPPARRHSDVPQQTPPPPLPARFYFQGHDEDDDDEHENDGENNIVGAEEKKTLEEQKEVRSDSTNIVLNDVKIEKRRTSDSQPPGNQIPVLGVSKKPNMKTSGNTKPKKNRTKTSSKFTRKCIKAKAALSECWKDHMTDHVFQHNDIPPNVQRHYSQREIATVQQQHHVTGIGMNEEKGVVSLLPNPEKRNSTTASFQPVWKETHMVLSSSVSDPIPNHIPNHCNDKPVSEKSFKETENIGTDTNASKAVKHIVSTGHVRDIIRTFSQETSTSTVLQSSKAVTTTSNYSHATTAVSTIVQLYPPYSNDKLAPARIDEDETTKNVTHHPTSIFRQTKNDSKTMCNPTNTDIQTTTSTLTTKEAKLSVSTSDPTNISNEINDGSSHRKRASIEKKLNQQLIADGTMASSKETTCVVDIANNVRDLHHKRRSEISIEMQRQIDEQLLPEMQPNTITTSKKVQRLRQHYQNDIVEKKKHFGTSSAIAKVKSPSNKAPANTIVSISSRAMTVAEARKAFEKNNYHVMPASFTKHRNAASVPNRKSYEYDAGISFVHAQMHQPVAGTGSSIPSESTGHPNQRRSISVPRGRCGVEKTRSSIDHSALLLLSKSWDGVSSNTTNKLPLQKANQQQQALPVLLQMAGWNPPIPKGKSTNLTYHTLVSQKAVIRNHTKAIESDTEGMLFAIPNKTAADDKPLSALKQIDQTVLAAKTTKKAKSFDHVAKYQASHPNRFDQSTKKVRKSTGNTTTGGRTIAFMLQQAYFGNDDDDEPTKANGNNSKNALATSHIKTKREMKVLSACSPALSIDSVSTQNSIPVVSDQATVNANFLFAQDGLNMVRSTAMAGNNGNTTLLLEPETINHNENAISSLMGKCKNHGESTSFTISTMDSRSRIVTSSASVATGSTVTTIVQRPSTTLPVAVLSSTGASDVKENNLSKPNMRINDKGSLTSISTITEPRRVRFSEESFLLKNEDTSTTSHGMIETKLSDLTENTVSKQQVHHNRESTSTSTSTCIDSIPEEDDNHTKENTPRKDKDYSSVGRWSYRTARTLSTTSSSSDDRGVTPLLGNKAKLKIGSPNETMDVNCPDRTTNSPFLRFKLARERFASSSGGVKTKKIVPQKRFSPVKAVKKSNGTALASTTTMGNKKRQGFVKCNTSIDSSAGAPHNAFLESQLKHTSISSSSQEMGKLMTASSSPLLINGHVQGNGSASTHIDGLNSEINVLNESASVVSYDSDDVFGAILHPTTIDDSGEDYNEDGRIMDSDFGHEETYNEESCHNEAPSRRPSSAAVPLLSANESDTTGSVTSVISSSGDTASVVPHWLLHQGGRHRTSVVTTTSDVSSVISAVSRMKNIQSQTLPFRMVAPVNPIEQFVQPKQKQSNGSNSVEPPRTWRKLAVVAQLQDMKHLQQTNDVTKENTVHHNVQQHRLLYDRSNVQ